VTPAAAASGVGAADPVVSADGLTKRYGDLVSYALCPVMIGGVGLWAVHWDIIIPCAVSGAFVFVAWRFFRWQS
jgi:hypothetical protein